MIIIWHLFCQYAFEASFFEIYNETIRDLLGDDGHSNDKKHEIKMKAAKSDEVYVTNLTTVNVTECAQVGGHACILYDALVLIIVMYTKSCLSRFLRDISKQWHEISLIWNNI